MTRKIGVVGAGTMGQGIANAFASAGNEVTVMPCAKFGVDCSRNVGGVAKIQFSGFPRYL